MIIWEGNDKSELSEVCVAALKALEIGYPLIRGVHGALLGTYGFCYRGPGVGYVITTEGRKALEVWKAGHDYDSKEEDRKHRIAARRADEPV